MQSQEKKSHSINNTNHSRNKHGIKFKVCLILQQHASCKCSVSNLLFSLNLIFLFSELIWG